MRGSAKLTYKLCEVTQNDDADAANSCTFDEEELSKPVDDAHHYINLGWVTFFHNSSKCHADHSILDTVFSRMKPKCIYAIAVEGLANYTTHFAVEAKHIEKQHSILKHGVPAKGLVEHKGELYYKFMVTSDNITDVVIQMTTIHGDPDLFVSRNYTFPNVSAFDRRSTRAG